MSSTPLPKKKTAAPVPATATAPTATTNTTTPPKNPTGFLVGLIILLGMVTFGIYHFSKKSPEEIQDTRDKKEEKERRKKEPTATTQQYVPPPQPVEALVLMHECMTPCSADIQWKFKIRTDGHAIKVKFPGMSWYNMPAEGDVKFPFTMNAGEAFFASLDEKNPNVRVQVYKKITTYERR